MKTRLKRADWLTNTMTRNAKTQVATRLREASAP
jgi:hypothetical protein